jgi:hypothetical protein
MQPVLFLLWLTEIDYYAGETPHTVTLFAFDDLVDTVSGAMVVILLCVETLIPTGCADGTVPLPPPRLY